MTDLIGWWTATYRGHDFVQFLSAVGHILSVAYAARFALNGDRAALRLTSGRGAARGEVLQQRDLETISHAHPHVIGGLACAFVTGIAQLLAQLSYLGTSPVFWMKMMLLIALLLNGWIVRGSGRALRTGGAAIDRASVLRTLRGAAVRSAVLWCILVVLGLVLTSIQPF